MKQKILVVLLTVSLFLTGLVYLGKNKTKALEKTKDIDNLIQKPEFLERIDDISEELIKDKTHPSVNEVQKEIALEEAKKKKAENNVMKNGTIEEKILFMSKKYGINGKIAVAISRLETGHWKSNPFKKYNNVGGMKYRGKIMKFDSLNEGIERFVKNLKKNYFDQGLNTPAKMQKKYCPPNSDWDEMVVKIMEMRMNRL